MKKYFLILLILAAGCATAPQAKLTNPDGVPLVIQNGIMTRSSVIMPTGGKVTDWNELIDVGLPAKITVREYNDRNQNGEMLVYEDWNEKTKKWGNVYWTKIAK